MGQKRIEKNKYFQATQIYEPQELVPKEEMVQSVSEEGIAQSVQKRAGKVIPKRVEVILKAACMPAYFSYRYFEVPKAAEVVIQNYLSKLSEGVTEVLNCEIAQYSANLARELLMPELPQVMLQHIRCSRSQSPAMPMGM